MFDSILQMLGLGNKIDYKQLMQKGAIIIDVRSMDEYKSGHISGARNIPLNELASQIKTIQQLQKPIITCCRSGARSGMAKSTLQQAGIEVYNGGPWTSLQQKIQ
jgi:rhodanese-related sulfurtransferase